MHGTGHLLLFWVAIISMLLHFWSWGVMHNFATDEARRLSSRNPGFWFDRMDESQKQQLLHAVPDHVAWINLIASAVAILLLLYGIIMAAWGV